MVPLESSGWSTEKVMLCRPLLKENWELQKRDSFTEFFNESNLQPSLRTTNMDDLPLSGVAIPATQIGSILGQVIQNGGKDCWLWSQVA